MKLRVLGAHNVESRHTRMESHLIDGVLALDAGSLTRSLTHDELRGIRAIILSHRHFDHVKDLLPLGIAVRNEGVTIDVYAIQDTVDAFAKRRSPNLRMHAVKFYEQFKVLGYDAMAVPVPHSVPAAGFQIGDGNVRLFYTGDTGRGLGAAWEHVAPDVLLTEVTFGNENEAGARAAGHLTPKLLMGELDAFSEIHGRTPQVVVSHINPAWEDAVRTELADITAATGQAFTIAEADMSLELGRESSRVLEG
ncbi:hypothetical protein GBAR_LOCUS9684 [Geodia barretti]|uniref:Metallo-beta-lactamase domain-containing protein n=1 Tax=Geodia barretti TaxID=519541 RepID=A0AA35WIK7_GEOBA|nr:hypothetical protein GBAR_LOCUS9684 [Geodia barretti]